MTENGITNMEDFLGQVMVDVGALELMDRAPYVARKALDPSSSFWEEEDFLRRKGFEREHKQEYFGLLRSWLPGNRKQLDGSLSEASTLSKSQKIKAVLCPVLESVTDDVREIAKAITPVLVTLAATHVITMPLESLLFAHLSLIISKAGVRGFCSDKNKEEQEVIVYINRASKIYHVKGCRSLKKQQVEITMDEARKHRFTLCHHCSHGKGK